MKPEIASAIVALRPTLEALVIRASEDPAGISQPSQIDEKVISVIKNLCKLNAGRHGMEQVGMGG